MVSGPSQYVLYLVRDFDNEVRGIARGRIDEFLATTGWLPIPVINKSGSLAIAAYQGQQICDPKRRPKGARLTRPWNTSTAECV